MKNPFLRLVALFLVPCLAIDSTTAFELCSARQTTASLSMSMLGEFSRQAIVAYLPSSPLMVRANEGLGHVRSSWLVLSRFLDLEIDKSNLGLPTGIPGRATARWISWFYNWGQRVFGWKDETIDRFIAPAWETLIFQGLFVLLPVMGIFFGQLFLLHWLGIRSTVDTLDRFSSLAVALLSGAAASQAISAAIFGSVRTHPKVREYGPPGKNQHVKVRDPSPAELRMLKSRVRRYGRWAVKMFGIFMAVVMLLMYWLNISDGAVYWNVLLTAVGVAILVGLYCAYDIHAADNRHVIDLTGGIVGTAAGGADRLKIFGLPVYELADEATAKRAIAAHFNMHVLVPAKSQDALSQTFRAYDSHLRQVLGPSCPESLVSASHALMDLLAKPATGILRTGIC